jgi:hypothetical protein
VGQGNAIEENNPLPRASIPAGDVG